MHGEISYEMSGLSGKYETGFHNTRFKIEFSRAMTAMHLKAKYMVI